MDGIGGTGGEWMWLGNGEGDEMGKRENGGRDLNSSHVRVKMTLGRGWGVGGWRGGGVGG